MTDKKFKVGDKVCVVNNHSDHGYCLGEVTTITDDSDPEGYNGDGKDEWFLYEEDIIKALEGMDNVEHPSHYNQDGIECIEAIKASLGTGFPDYCKGNVMKYLWRYKYKNGLEDLKKAQVYLNWMVEAVEKETKE